MDLPAQEEEKTSITVKCVDRPLSGKMRQELTVNFRLETPFCARGQPDLPSSQTFA